jgi:hypothetical protein
MTKTASRLTVSQRLDLLDDLYGQLLDPHAAPARRLDDERHLRDLRSDFERDGFVQVAGVLPREPLTRLADHLIAILSPLSLDVAMRHDVDDAGRLTHGHRFRRFDPETPADPDNRAKMRLLLDRIGITEFTRILAERLSLLVTAIAGPVVYRRAFFNLYTEGDYIGPHDDGHMGDRVSVYFPVPLGAQGALRVLRDGHLRLWYDVIGAMNVLGPRVWHDVPPLVRDSSGPAPRRLNLVLKFDPAPGS